MMHTKQIIATEFIELGESATQKRQKEKKCEYIPMQSSTIQRATADIK